MFEVFKNKTVLISGHTGFKGSWLTIWLESLGAKVIGISKGVPSDPCHYSSAGLSAIGVSYNIDICDSESVGSVMKEHQPDFVFHLAAQALVKKSYAEPFNTLSTNALGTASILDALNEINKNVVAIIITSDKVYENQEWIWGYRENDTLGGVDPYSLSKSMAEFAIRSYCNSQYSRNSHNVRVCIARAGNVIGGGDWAQDRIVPDCVKAWSRDEVVEIRSPFATRPWQHVLEPLSGYLTLAKRLSDDSYLHKEAFNFGPSSDQNCSVEQLISGLAVKWGEAKWCVNSPTNAMKEANLLKLNCEKAYEKLDWEPTLELSETISFTADWYRNYYDESSKNAYSFSLFQINQYMEIAKSRNRMWIS